MGETGEENLDREEEEVGEFIADDPSNLTSLIGHFYRGEVDRVTTWRSRLDQTTNWAVTIMAAILTWAFSSPDNPHYIILIGVLMVSIFLGMETRRYQTYDIWRSRVRLLEEDLFANALDPRSGIIHRDWRKDLSEDLRRPTIKVPLFEALGRRLRRVYLPLLYVLLAAWVFRVLTFESAKNWRTVAAIGPIPGVAVVGIVIGAYVAATAIAFWPRERQAMGEFHEDEEQIGEWKR